jgi:hypothetical protein
MKTGAGDFSMKKLFLILLLFITVPLFAVYKTEESFYEYYTSAILCADKNKSYVLISNGYNVFPEYLIVYGDDKYSARQCYGELLLAYYHVKNNKKEIKEYRPGELYTVYMDNSEEEIAFLRALTDSFILQEYPSFFFIDKNSSKKEAIEFYDNFEGENKEDEIGSSAGILMGIKASDFIDMLQEIKK